MGVQKEPFIAEEIPTPPVERWPVASARCEEDADGNERVEATKGNDPAVWQSGRLEGNGSEMRTIHRQVGRRKR